MDKKKTKSKKKKKNIHDMDEFMKNVNTTDIAKENEPSTREKIRMYFARSRKITQRDLVVFTQNFYLLKKSKLQQHTCIKNNNRWNRKTFYYNRF